MEILLVTKEETRNVIAIAKLKSYVSSSRDSPQRLQTDRVKEMRDQEVKMGCL